MQASCDALAVDKGLAGDELLCAGYQIALDHDADDVWISLGNLAATSMADNGWRR